MRPMSASARYLPLLTWKFMSRSLGHTRREIRVAESKSTLAAPIRLKPTRIKRTQGKTAGAFAVVGASSVTHAYADGLHVNRDRYVPGGSMNPPGSNSAHALF